MAALVGLIALVISIAGIVYSGLQGAKAFEGHVNKWMGIVGAIVVYIVASAILGTVFGVVGLTSNSIGALIASVVCAGGGVAGAIMAIPKLKTVVPEK